MRINQLSITKINPIVLAASLAVFSVLFVLGTYFFGIKFSLALAIPLIAIPLILAIVFYPKFGILAFLIGAYFVMWVIRIGVPFPLGTLMDAMELLLIIGVLFHLKRHKDWMLFRDPISYMILIWIGYNMIQLANPSAESRLSWLYTIRSVALLMLTYFIFVIQINSVSFIRTIFKVWITLAVIAALYAMKQEYIGFFYFEEKSIDNPLQRSLLFIDGRWRKFSIFSDPVTFSYNMVISTILCLVLLMNQMKIYKKIILVACAGLLILAMLFSGTRGAYPLIPLAIALLVILKFNKKVLIASSIGFVFFAVLVVMPTSNPNIKRFQSAFSPSDDASFNLRKINQKRIQPYIQSHPLGGGLGATGTWGNRFAPGSYLANFPPDSGYVRVAVELGTIGMLLFCTLMFVILKTGIKNYLLIKDPELKNYCLAMVLVVFALNIGNYPQEALVQFPNSVLFYLVVALINVCYLLDRKMQHQSQNI